MHIVQGEVKDLRTRLDAMQQVTIEALKERGLVTELQMQLEAVKAQLEDVLLHHRREAARSPDKTLDSPTRRNLDSSAGSLAATPCLPRGL